MSESGTVIVSPLAPQDGAAAEYLQDLDGRACVPFGPSNAGYFAWHRSHTFRDTLLSKSAQ